MILACSVNASTVCQTAMLNINFPPLLTDSWHTCSLACFHRLEIGQIARYFWFGKLAQSRNNGLFAQEIFPRYLGLVCEIACYLPVRLHQPEDSHYSWTLSNFIELECEDDEDAICNDCIMRKENKSICKCTLKVDGRQFPCAESHNFLTPDLVCIHQACGPIKKYPEVTLRICGWGKEHSVRLVGHNTDG